MCLTEKQTDYVYKTVEDGNIINTKTMMYETDQNQDGHPYKKVVLNKVYREEDKSPEMRNWSIFSENIRYIQHEQKTSHKLNIDTLDYRQHKELYFKLKGEERETLDIDFGIYPDLLKEKSEQKNDFLLLVKDLLQRNYWMVLNVKFCWTLVPQSPTCQNLTICNAKLYMYYQNFLLMLKEFK